MKPDTEGRPEERNFVMQLTNAGVLIDMDGCRILIDPFSAAHNQQLRVSVPFAGTTADQAEKLISRKGVFRHVDLMLISHDHVDHYSLPLTCRFLEHHPETTLAARAYLIDEIREACGEKLENPCLVLKGEDGKTDRITAGGVGIRAWSTRHAGTTDYYQEAKHLTFRLDGSWSCVFLGDMEPSEDNFDRIQDAACPDVAVVPYLYAILRKAEKILDSRMTPGLICFNHIPDPEGEAGSWRNAVYTRVSRLRELNRNRIVLDEFGMMIPMSESVGKR